MSRHAKRKRCKKRHSASTTSSENPEDVLDVPEDGCVFGVKTSQVMGRYMVARRNLKAGDTILSEEPIVVGPCTGCKVQCLGCYRPLEDSAPYVKCKKCGWPLCSWRCPGLGTKHGHTQIECAVLETTGSSRLLDFENVEKLRTHYHAIAPLRCLLLKDTDPAAYADLTQMETHNAIRRNVPELWRNNQVTVVDRIIKDWDLKEYSEEEIHSICGILEINAFEIGQGGVSIRGLYPTAFLMSHDCVPNTNHVDEERTYRLTVRASTSIEVDEMVTLSYAYTLQSTLKRREHLLENKFFECLCRRCLDPTELGTFTGALLCPRCKQGRVLSVDPLDADADWRCDSKTCAGYKITSRSMQLLIERITQEADSMDCNDVVAMEAFLQKYRNVLHPTHYLNLGAKLSLSQLYGRVAGYLIDELKDDLLERKLEICEEIMEVFDVIEPGYTRLRGVTLYEMHAPLMIMLTRQFEGSKCSKSVLRAKLKRVVRCLEEAGLILGYEPETSPEGMMGVAAKDALLRIKEWEKILGKF